MNKRYLKWLLYIGAPLCLLLPLNMIWNFNSFFKTIVLQPQKTGITTLNFYDKARERPVTTEVWYPVDRESPAQAAAGFWLRCDEARDAPISKKLAKYPLIVLSHGNGGDRFNISWLAEILASNGYIVAAMDHYGNTWNNKIPKCYAKPWERPKDVSFVISELLNDATFKDRINTKKIGFSGYSLGGATGIWVAGATPGQVDPQSIAEVCQQELKELVTPDIIKQIDFNEVLQSFHDERVGAFLLMAPALGWLFDETSLNSIDRPVYIFTTEKDRVVSPEKNAQLFAKRLSKATLKIFKGDGDHYVFLNCASRMGKRILEPKLCEDAQTVERRKIHEEIGKLAIEFFDTHLH